MNRIRVTIQEVKRAGVPLRKDFALSVLFQAYQDVRPTGEAVVQSDGDQNLALADCDYHIAGCALEVVDRALQVRAEKILADIERQICEVEQGSTLPAPASGLHINEAQFDLVIWEKADTPVKVEYEAGLVSEVRLHVKHNDEQRDINLKFTKGNTGEDGYLLIFTDKAKIWEVTVLIKWECYQEKVPRDEEKHL